MSQPRLALVPGSAKRIGTLFSPEDGEDALWQKLEGFAREAYGVTSMMYAFTHSKYTVSRTGIMPSLYLRHSHPADYLATFPNGLTLDDGVAAGLLLEGQTPLLWSDFPSLDLKPRQRRRLAEDQACGMGVGVSFGFRFGANSGVSALCWASRHADAAAFKAMVHARRSEMEGLAATFDGLMRPVMIRNRIHLTPREKDVLSYSAGGMSAKQIAEHLGSAPRP